MIELETEFDVAVIGGGPAGITAAVQVVRSDWKVALFEQEHLGGLMLNANLVENYPSGAGPVPGRKLANLFRSHLEQFPVNTVTEKIIDISTSDNHTFELATSRGTYHTRAVILAAGTVPRPIELPGLENLDSDRVCYDIRVLQPLPENNRYAVIGGGDAAFDYALQLARNKNKVTILVRASNANCLKLLERRVSNKPELIDVKYEAEVENLEPEGDGRKINIYYKSRTGGGKLKANNLLIAAGRIPNDFLLKLLSEKVSDSIRIELNGKTNIPGFYLAGDIISGSYRQVGIAVGDGLRAAMMVDEFLAGDEAK